MTYSQKYSLVQFFEEVDETKPFSMYEWPLHITLVDVFAVERTPEFMAALQQYIDTEPFARTTIMREGKLGDTDVWLLEPTKDLLEMHSTVMDILDAHGATCNTPAFTRKGYIPHITKQKSSNPMKPGDGVQVSVLSLVDMFPDGDWQQRKIIQRFVPRHIDK